MQTTFPRLMLEHAKARPDAPALREKEYGIWQTMTWSALAALVRALACGMAERGVARGDHVVVVGENRPRLYAAMLAAQSLGAVPVPLYQDAVAPEYVFPINNAEIRFAVVEDQEQVDKMLELREQCPQLAHIWFDDPRGLRKYDEPGLLPLDDLIAAGQAFDASHAGYFDAAVAKTQPQDVAAMFFTSGTTGNPKGVVHTHFTLLDRAGAGQRFDKLTEREEVLAYMPPAWVGQNIFSYAQWLACGYVVNCPESNATVTIRPQGDRPHLLLCAAAHLRRPADQRDDPHGRRRGAQAPALPPLHGCRAPRRPGADGRQGGVLRRQAGLRHRQPGGLRPAAQFAGAVARAGGLHGRRGHRARPVHLLPLDRHQPQAAVRQHRDRRVRVPASPTTKPRPTPWACRSKAWRSSWPTAARSWSAAPAC